MPRPLANIVEHGSDLANPATWRFLIPAIREIGDFVGNSSESRGNEQLTAGGERI